MLRQMPSSYRREHGATSHEHGKALYCREDYITLYNGMEWMTDELRERKRRCSCKCPPDQVRARAAASAFSFINSPQMRLSRSTESEHSALATTATAMRASIGGQAPAARRTAAIFVLWCAYHDPPSPSLPGRRVARFCEW